MEERNQDTATHEPISNSSIDVLCLEIGVGFDLAKKLPDRVITLLSLNDISRLRAAAHAKGETVLRELNRWFELNAQNSVDDITSAPIDGVWI